GEKTTVLAELRGGRVVEETGRVGGTHLEGHAHLKLSQHHAVEHAVHVVERIAPDERMHAPCRTISQYLCPLLVRARRLVAVRRESEIVLAAAKIAEAATVEDDEVDRRSVFFAGRFAPSKLNGYLVDNARGLAHAGDFDVGGHCGANTLPRACLWRF